MIGTRQLCVRFSRSAPALLWAVLIWALSPSPASGFVRSVEYLEVALGTSQTSNFANLTKGQTVANCVPFASSMGDAGADGYGNMFTDVYLTAGSPPRVNVQRNLTGGALSVGVFVVEFDPTYVKVQQGTFAFAAGNAGPVTAGITGVSSLTRAALVFYNRNNFASGGNGYNDIAVEGSFSAVNQLSFLRNAATPTIDGHWYVFEALNVAGSYSFVVQPTTFTFSTASGSAALAPSVGSTETFVVGSYRTSVTQDRADRGAFRLYLSGCSGSPSMCSSVTAESYTGNTATTVTAFVVTFASGVRVQRGAFNYAATGGGATQQTATLSPAFVVAQTMIWNGMGAAPGGMMADENSGDLMYDASQRLKLANSTTVQGNRGAFTTTAVGTWEAVEWSTATTAVTLASLEASGLDRAVEVKWETASELNNLGFHLYRATSKEGPYERITPSLIPGLGSSPSGARYRHRDEGLENGVTHYYKLEDVETTGKTRMHGPVDATPGVEEETEAASNPTSGITYGDPLDVSMRILKQTSTEMVLELRTGGFYATPQPDGTVAVAVPGFVLEPEPGAAVIPSWRSWLEVGSPRQVRIVAVRTGMVQTFSSLQLAASDGLEVGASRNGTVRLRSTRSRSAHKPNEDAAARVLSVGYQGDSRKALIELSPLSWDGKRREISLARVLTVTLGFSGKEAHRELPSHRRRALLRRLLTSEPGLYGVSFEKVFTSNRRELPTRSLRLSRLGEAVAYHVEPNPGVFGPGSTLYFQSKGSSLNPYGDYAAYDLERGEGMTMAVEKPSNAGSAVEFYWQRMEREENRYYQAGLLEAEDVWLWDLLFAPMKKSYSFEVRGLTTRPEPSRLEVWLQGTSDFEASPDHHLRVYVNGTLVAESSFDGKESRRLSVEVPLGVLHEGENQLEIENVGDTAADYSMVMLDRYAVTYPRLLGTEAESFEGTFPSSGVGELSGFSEAPFLLELTEQSPRWLGVAARLRVEAGHRYLAVSPRSVLEPRIVAPRVGRLQSPLQQADYLVVGPQAFLSAARPLLELRQGQGLRTRAVAIEEVYSEFGFGEPRPQAVKDFLAYAYHHWKRPSPRYVLLLGDGSYDFKDYLGTGVENHVPPLLVKTSFLWTASDPGYASVNGDDVLPDLAIGRLPAASVEEVRVMVGKILAYERSGALEPGPIVLVADNPDEAGNFTANAEELANGILSSRDPQTIYLDRLGSDATRQAIRDAFDRGAGLVSYVGHGGIHLWANENVFDRSQVSSLARQAQQPLVLTFNCLNGYFHFPYFNSLSEELLKAEGKGAIAAFSPSGLSLDGPAHLFHRALLTEVLSGRHRRLGDAVLSAQESYALTGAFPELLGIYHLLGDPGLSLRPSR